MIIDLGMSTELMELRTPTDSPLSDDQSSVQVYAIPYEIPGLTPPDHVHCVPVSVIAELEMMYGMLPEQAIEYVILMRSHTISIGFDPEEDWNRYYADTTPGQMEQAVRALEIPEKFRLASLEASLVVPLVEGREDDAVTAVRGCIKPGSERPGIPPGEAGRQAQIALDSYFAARENAAELPARYLTEHSINKRAGGWSRVQTVCMNTNAARTIHQHRIFDTLIGTPVRNSIRDRAERAGFSNSERST